MLVNHRCVFPQLAPTLSPGPSRPWTSGHPAGGHLHSTAEAANKGGWRHESERSEKRRVPGHPRSVSHRSSLLVRGGDRVGFEVPHRPAHPHVGVRVDVGQKCRYVWRRALTRVLPRRRGTPRRAGTRHLLRDGTVLGIEIRTGHRATATPVPSAAVVKLHSAHPPNRMEPHHLRGTAAPNARSQLIVSVQCCPRAPRLRRQAHWLDEPGSPVFSSRCVRPTFE